jgi:hypothetical protein
VLLSRAHPNVRTSVGDSIWARIQPGKSVAMPAGEVPAAAPH